MLKKICGLFLGLIVCAGSACVTPTHASSASPVVIRYIQAAGAAGARDELIIMHNNSPIAVEVTNWCLKNKTNTPFVCFTATEERQQEAGGVFRYFLPPYGDMTVASMDHANSGMYNENFYSFAYTVLTQSSGSLVGSSDTLSLVNANEEVVDMKTWSSTAPTNKALARVAVMPNIYAVGNDTADWVIISTISFVESSLVTNIEDFESTVPEEPDPEDEVGEDEEEEQDPLNPALLPPTITELFPNPSGADAGKEFIELYNPNPANALLLDAFTLKVGDESPKFYSFPDGATIPAGQYITFSDEAMDFTLVNTAGVLQLMKNNAPVGDAVTYSSAKDDQSWALVGGIWQYITELTPGAENMLPVEIRDDDEEEASAAPKPCADNQYRNPETGRCKLIASATATPAPCKVGQERKPETNRCRTLATTSEPAPCKEGQERNPDTNRCRNIVKMTEASYGVKGVQHQTGAQLSWYYIATIILVVLAILAYAVWEWRQELTDIWQRVRKVFARR